MTYKEENIVNIAMKAAELLISGKIELDDNSGHMGLTNHIISLSEQFEKKNSGIDYDTDGRDYWVDIDEFAEQELIAEYGRKENAIETVSEKEQESDNMIKLWARVGMTMEVTPETYDQLKAGSNEALESVLFGNGGTAYVDGETYFPDIEQNMDLCEMEFYPKTPTMDVSTDKAPDFSLLPEDPVKVYAVAGSVRHEMFSGDWDECKEFCESLNWTYVDDNQFQWDLEMEDSRENDFPEGFYDAIEKFSKEHGGTIDCEFVRQHAEEFVSCYQNELDLLDFDFWTQYESLLGETISYEEYSRLDFVYAGDPLDLTPDNKETISFLKDKLSQFREILNAKESSRPSLNDQIQGAESRQSQRPFESGGKDYGR